MKFLDAATIPSGGTAIKFLDTLNVGSGGTAVTFLDTVSIPNTQPNFAQQDGAFVGSGTACSWSFTSAPTAGNLLVCFVTVQVGRTVTMPSGWSASAATKTGSQIILTVYTKTADGSETTGTVNQSSSGLMSLAISEWSNAATTVDAYTTGSTASAASPLAFGPTPPLAVVGSIPFVGMGWRGHGTTGSYVASSPWAWGGITAGNFSNTSSAAITAGLTLSSTVSGTVAYTNTNEDGFDFLWIALWVKPK